MVPVSLLLVSEVCINSQTAHDFQVIEQSGVIFTLSVMIQSRPEAFQVDVLIDSIADVLETDTFREPAYY